MKPDTNYIYLKVSCLMVISLKILFANTQFSVMLPPAGRILDPVIAIAIAIAIAFIVIVIVIVSRALAGQRAAN